MALSVRSQSMIYLLLTPRAIENTEMRSTVFSALLCAGLASAVANTFVDWDTAVSKANAILAELTLEEKTAVVTGANPLTGLGCIGSIGAIPRLNFSGICYSDGSSGVNRADLTSVFPAGLTAAATWDADLMYRRAVAIGEEFRAKGMHACLGPVAGPLGRHPLGGRVWEGFSPDPYLTGIAMDRSIRGLQSVGVQSITKHFIGNEQETQRTNVTLPDGSNIDAVSTNMDDRTLHELYLWPFMDAINAKPAAVMCSYNRFNQTYTCEHSKLLTGILRDELGFEGYTVSDWYATHSTAASINAGLDMEMPGTTVPGQGTSWFGSHVKDAVQDGSVSTNRLHEMVRRILTQYYLLGQDDSSFPSLDPSTLSVIATQYQQNLGDLVSNTPARDVRGDHAKLIREIGAAGVVLLKNNNTLPLMTPMNIGVFGNDAGDLTDGLIYQDPPATNVGFEYGTLDIGGGSSSVRHTYVVTPLDAIKERAKGFGARVQYILNNERLAAGDFHSIYPVPDVCIVFLKTFAAEGFDRVSFEADWKSTTVVTQVANVCNNTVVITHSVGVNTMPWASHPNVRAIIAAHLPGEQTGNSIADVLWGDVNPSGRLPYTIPKTEAGYDIPVTNLTSDEVSSPGAWQANFTEGLNIDYRHFDAEGIEPLYEFGFGLSYTTFDLSSDLSVKALTANMAPLARAANESSVPLSDLFLPVANATIQVANTGDRSGATVVQLYLSLPTDSAPSGTPVQVLRGFSKVELRPGETREVAFELNRRDFSYWDTDAQTWRIPVGDFQLHVGFSSRNLLEPIKFSML
ncbi:glycosyl hydrolase family 3 N terminal domain-containing protein [Colletotrichum melonis]|uniref:Beta-glucosidase cel3A n=1 Tax=Colletotrichum melonis TaxID=1209925 RepID=A0AAI9XYY3_9PEZI|nr:glycosyl hydrolase family 3 N terminal domain-containing protein [Colletotrichum melonis]